MITYVDFSLFDSPARVIVNTVNTVGVMGQRGGQRIQEGVPRDVCRVSKGMRGRTV